MLEEEVKIEEQTPVETQAQPKFFHSKLASEVPQPIEAPVTPIIEPQVTPDVQIQEAVKVEEPKIEPIKAPKSEPVQDLQAVESNKLINEANAEKVNTQKEVKATAQFDQMIQSGATNEELASYVNKNPQFRDSFNASAKSYFKTSANGKFFGTYNGMSNESMLAATKTGELVPWSSQYNLLSESQRQSFESYRAQAESDQIVKTTNFSTSEKVLSLDSVLSEVQKLYSSDLRTKSEQLFNSPAIVEVTGKLAAKKAEIEKFDIEMEDVEERMRKELSWNLPAVINSAVRDEKNALVKDKRLLLAEYNASLGEYQTLKSDATQELEFYKYEDQQNKEIYNTALGLYESRRAEGLASQGAAVQREQEIEDMLFLQQNKQIAEDSQRAFQLQLKEIDQQYKLENKEPKYETDREGNLIAISNGVATKVRDASGEIIGIERTKDYTDTVAYDKDNGTRIVTRTYDDGSGRIPDTFVSAIDGSSSYNTNMWAQGIIWQIPTKWKHPNGGLWCGEFTNIYNKKGGLVSATTWEAIHVGNSYQSKKDAINSPSPQIGGLAVWNPSPEGKYGENGHIGIVTGYNPSTWEVEITDSNSKGNWEQATYTIPVSQINNSDGGFVHMENPNAPLDASNNNYSRSAENWAKNIQSGGDFKITSIKDEDLRTEVSNYLAENPIQLSPDSPLVQWIQWQADIATDLLEDESMARNVSGRVQRSFTSIFTGEKEQYIRKLQFLLDEQPLNKLISVKAQGGTFGALSEKELALLTKSSSLLNSAANRDEAGNITWFTMDETDFINNMKVLRDNYKALISTKTGNESIQDIDLEAEMNTTDDSVYF